MNAVSPGAVRTEALADLVGEGLEQLGGRYSHGRLAEPEEIADVIVYLVSDQASYVNGASLDVDGRRAPS